MTNSRPLAAFLTLALWLCARPHIATAQDAPKGWTTVELRASVHGLSDGFSSWNEQEMRVERRASVRSGAGLSMARLWRFDEEDRRIAADASLALGSRLTMGAEGESSPTHRIAARLGARGWMHLALGRGWAVQLAALERRYETGVLPRVQSASASVEKYAGPWYASYSYTAGRAVDDTPTSGHQGRITRFWGRRSAVTATLATGTEAENLGWRGIQVMDVKGAALWGDIPLGGHLSLVYGGAVTQQGTLYSRRSLSLGLRARTN